MTNKNKKDPNQIAYIEKAIAKKFGKEAIINPKSGWTDEKEKEYLEQLNEFYSKKRKKSDENEKVDKEGFLLSKNLSFHKRSNLRSITFTFPVQVKSKTSRDSNIEIKIFMYSDA